MALGIKLSALLSLGMSLLVLFSIVLNHLELRKIDMKLLSFMGFSKSMLRSLFFKKFFIILFLSVILSTAVATGLSLLLLTHFLNVEYSLTLLRTLAPGLTITVFLSLVILIKLKSMQSKRYLISSL
jgi:predicted lysophospholipase L1 biosynthesis ABC-type transport system permease subunit